MIPTDSLLVLLKISLIRFLALILFLAIKNMLAPFSAKLIASFTYPACCSSNEDILIINIKHNFY